jgi:hypothetical protein
MPFEYTYHYTMRLYEMRESVGRAIDLTEDEDQQDEFRDLYNNICLELFELKRKAQNYQLSISHPSHEKPPLVITTELPPLGTHVSSIDELK